MKKALILCLMFSFSSMADQYGACIDKSDGITSNIRDCDAQEMERLDHLLNKAYKHIINELKQNEQLEQVNRLKEAQRAWLKYRDANCGFIYSETGGTIDLLNGDGCIIEMTKDRTKQLEEFAEQYN
ncbi:DUF1311 domain-containing protein [Salmonella enterica]|nr:DUF1311 domain-containing protein [Salmonella enterica]EDW0581189.1 DUF1311 domain-containing protein [Salmonella enterica subsp. enterica serovar Poona]EBD0564738.1 DUF1311 domain-containing protein [Salmonella enterica]EBD1341639.1 DUF1311 domain-containing protein [Salmonella enterica]EBI2536819.1 DUF1311 domain-containing protein [Salmonella enterica]